MVIQAMWVELVIVRFSNKLPYILLRSIACNILWPHMFNELANDSIVEVVNVLPFDALRVMMSHDTLK